jgi:hypothetical protein
MKNELTTVINFCSGDRNFLEENVANIEHISDEIIVPYCTHLFSGNEDNIGIIESMKKDLPHVKFIEFGRDNIDIYSGPNIARWVGFNNTKTEHILFVDADEIFDKDMIGKWYNNTDLSEIDFGNFDAYFYFLETKYQALRNDNWESAVGYFEGGNGTGFINAIKEFAGLIVKKDLINSDKIFHRHERWSFISDHGFKKQIKTSEGETMLHHYAYVRDKDQMIRKTNNWAHKNDRPWAELTERYFNDSDYFMNNEFRDFVHGYQYKTIVPIHDIQNLKDFDKNKGF